MNFHKWFQSNFGEVPSVADLEAVQAEIEELRFRIKRLKEKRSKIIETQTLHRSAFYAWQLKDNQKLIDNEQVGESSHNEGKYGIQ